ncbi:DUF4357 domain-containing protein [Clostridium algoriphilum]|uniref:DUF4357 domain-containing protein n=1 Tax=Clostridium algoriphilum TaxID=198347 RepID=UPI001CF338C1|nr:DUF4357 domain-containing protein [Clostridium algoriphilum]MCB2295921.1 DUF4357 domain-containing protein [Clostridium algoriphilum]
MEAKQKQIIEFLSTTNTQFTIPVYQRNYNWEEKQCSILLEDIIKVSESENIPSHFLGSIVYLYEGVYTIGKKEFSIIDGQQRLTTITLLLCVIYHKTKKLGNTKVADMIYERYLTDKYIIDEDKFKLIPPGKNLKIFKKILDEKFEEIQEDEKENNFINNYRFFDKEIMSLETIDKIIIGIQKLIYVDIALEMGKDDPQKIFESLNSTGLDLSQGDLIRNFILMNLKREEQNRIYEDYWIPLEENTKILKKNTVKIQISEFMRDFLTLEFGKIPNQSKVYEDFKNNYEYINFDKLEEELKKIRDYSSIYSIILNPKKEKDLDLRDQFRYLKSLDQSVINPFIMGIYKDYRNGSIDKKILIQIMELIQNYILRRYICGEPTNALNKIFMNLYSKIKKDDYYVSIETYILKQNFPDDKKLKDDIKLKPLYKDREKLLYLFEKIENYGHNELVDVYSENITIEHIFPQKPEKKWRSILSDTEFEKMLSLKDTIANLTLTGSNSNLGNKVFIEKRDMPIRGYKDSKLFLNKWLSKQTEWNLNKMDERFNEIFSMIIKIWKSPKIDVDGSVSDNIFYCQGVRGQGKGNLIDDKFIILKGSRASKFLSDSIKVSNSNIIEKLIKNAILKEEEEFYTFIADYTVNSPSAAAKLILGRSANGWTEWRTYEGDVLDSFREKEPYVTK